jgi:D-3-phosphoglycerate dehydrogenase
MLKIHQYEYKTPLKILVADDVHSHLTVELTNAGHEVDYLPNINREELIQILPSYDGLVIRTKTTIDEAVLSHAVKLKFIARAGAGIDNIDEAFCQQHNIIIVHVAGANADAVGEQAVGMLISLLANITKSDKQVRKKLWDREGNRGIQLSSQVVGIIGYGYTGKAFARKLLGFGCQVIAYDKYLSDYGDVFAKAVSLEELFKRATVVSFHVPFTLETHHYFNQSFIQHMQNEFCLLNLSRGEVVNTDDLIAGLLSGKVRFAGLDVLENEKLNNLSADETERFNKLSIMENVLLTPHIGGWTHESYLEISKALAQKIKQLTKDYEM